MHVGMLYGEGLISAWTNPGDAVWNWAEALILFQIVLSLSTKVSLFLGPCLGFSAVFVFSTVTFQKTLR